MSANAKIGTHPDAESLNAFAEQALNATERGDVLAHLAVCGRCREIVTLAQPVEVFEEVLAVAAASSQPAAAAASPAIVRKRPWWQNWRYVLTPVAAIAAIVVVSVTIHERHLGQIAQLEKQTQQFPPQMQDKAAKLEAPARPEAIVRAVTPQLAQKKQGAPESQAVTAAQPTMFAGASSSVSGLAAAAPPLAESAKPIAPAEQSSLKAESQAANMPASAENVDAAAQALAPAPASPSAAATAAADAAEAAPKARTGQKVSALGQSTQSFALRTVKSAPLPSGLAKISTATRQRATVAIDSAGGVFLSDDGGANWRPVKQQWTGRAARAALSASGTTLELTNDQNATWLSTDGATWTPR